MTTDVPRLDAVPRPGVEASFAVASAVRAELERQDRSVLWLSSSSGIDVRTLEQKLAVSRPFTVVDLAEIAAALEVPVAQLAPPLPGR